MYFHGIKHPVTEASINDPIDSDGNGNALTIADISTGGKSMQTAYTA